MDWSLLIDALLLIITFVSTAAAIYYAHKSYKQNVEGTINISQKLTVFQNRDSMVQYLHTMYLRAETSDVIWGQSMSGRHYGDVQSKIMDAASRGVHFKMIFNAQAQTINQIEGIFRSLKSADVIALDDNKIRIQGLSNKEVVISLSDNMHYYAIAIRDEAVVEVLREWFDTRFANGKNNIPTRQER